MTLFQGSVILRCVLALSWYMNTLLSQYEGDLYINFHGSVILPYCIKAKKMYEHNALGYWSGLSLCLTKVRSSRACCPATALINLEFYIGHYKLISRNHDGDGNSLLVSVLDSWAQ